MQVEGRQIPPTDSAAGVAGTHRQSERPEDGCTLKGGIGDLLS
jgi:hypothetical protein